MFPALAHAPPVRVLQIEQRPRQKMHHGLALSGAVLGTLVIRVPESSEQALPGC